MVPVRGITQIIAKNDELYSSQKPYQSDRKRLIFLVNVENQNIKEDKDRNIKIQCALFMGVERDEFIDKKNFAARCRIRWRKHINLCFAISTWVLS